jgi:hypothetical protein
LAEFIARATVDYRKGPEVDSRQIGNMRAVEIFDMPAAEQAPPSAVDVGFVLVGFTEHAADQEGFGKLLAAAVTGPGAYHTFAPGEFLGGPSYITAGAWIGSQDLALRLYALLEHYELAQVVTPARLVDGIEEEKAREMMGRGFVMFAPTPKLKELLTT